MHFYPQFAWAVPIAFKDAIANYSFGEGDILYDTPKAYQQWSEALIYLQYSIQVTYPPRNFNVKASKKSLKRNWASPVKLSLVNHKNNSRQHRETTQGKLFTLLWHGNIDMLNMEVQSIELPLSLLHAKKYIPDTISAFKGLITTTMIDPLFFILPYDLVNDISAKKIIKLNAILKKDFNVIGFDLPASGVGINIDTASLFSPTIYFKCFVIYSNNLDRIHELLKSALYAPDINAKHQRFNLKTHGLLTNFNR